MPSTLFELAERNNVSLPMHDPAYHSPDALLQRYKKFSSLDDFLKYYYRAMSVLLNKRDFEDLTYAYLKRAHDDGVIHAEMFFDPQAHLERVSFETVIEGVEAGRRRAEKDFEMSTIVIMCFLRHLGQEPALELFHDQAVQTYLRNGTITGIGLDSSEIGYPPELFQMVYEEAQQMGLRLTAHAGEEGPAANIKTSLDVLRCQRIDHGLRITENGDLMKRIASDGMLLTLCPLSNVNLKCLRDVSHAPIRTFLSEGIAFSINSDDPAYLGGFILENYCAVQEAFSLTVEEWELVCLHAINGSWCPEQRKVQMRRKLTEVLQKTSTKV